MQDSPLDRLTQHSRAELLELQRELASRQLEAVRLYKPNANQKAIHECVSKEMVILGGNRCLAGEQELYDPVLDRTVRVDEIDSDFHVLSWDGESVVVKPACRPFVKGYGELYEVTLSNGETIRTTLQHRVYCGDEGWLSVSDAHLRSCGLLPLSSTEESSLQASWQGACRSTQTLQGCLGGCSPGCCRCGGQPRSAQETGPTSSPSPADARGHSHWSCSAGVPGDSEECSQPCLSSLLPASQCADPRSWVRDDASVSPAACKPCSRPLGSAQESCQSQPQSCPRPRTGGEVARRPSESCCESPSQSPRGESVYITSLRPIGQQLIWDITVEDTACYFAGGVLHHNSGKTTAALAEFAMAVTNAHPIEGKYPKEGTAVVVGAGWGHIGRTIYPGLFKAGAFKIIKDAQTGEWRAFDPVADEERSCDAKPAPPLIPPRLIKQCSWILKSAGYMQSCELTTGWTIYLFSSEGDPPQGFRADVCLFDEDLANESTWVAEMQARLADRRGRFIWSATPHSRNDALFGICERADKAAEEGLENPKKFVLRFLDNEHIPKEARALAVEQWASQGDEVLRMRAEGEFTFNSVLMYAGFNMGIHGLDRKNLPGGEIPADWCRYAAIDPGHAICAVLFAAVPPTNDMVLLYDELYIPNCSALIFGEQFHRKVAGQPQFHAFFIDSHGARLTDIGGGRSPGQQYSEQLELLGVRSRITGASFIPGSDDVIGGIESVRNAMHIRPNGTPRLRVLTGALPNFIREIKRYKRQSTVVGGQNIVLDKPHPRSVSHLLDCMRYLMAADIRYHKPEQVTEKPWWWDSVQKRRAQRGQEEGVVYLSPASYTSEIYV